MINNKEEKICSFFVSDFHFEMISLPYISRSLEENKNVIIMTENNLKDTIQVLVSKMNLKEDKKKNILNLNWENKDIEKFKILKKCTDEDKQTIILIKGKENYIKNVNENIQKWIENKNVKVIDCYEIEEMGEKIDLVMSRYDRVLGTMGEKEIQKI